MLEKLKKIMTIARGSLINTASAEYSGGKTSETGGIENAAMEKLLDKYSKKIYLDIFAPLFRQGKENGECNSRSQRRLWQFSYTTLIQE